MVNRVEKQKNKNLFDLRVSSVHLRKVSMATKKKNSNSHKRFQLIDFCWLFKHVGLATLSTSTSSYEPLETHDPTLNRLAVTMFQKVHEYLQVELTSSQSEYQLLEQMNKVTAAKYKDLTQVANSVGKGIIELNEKCTFSLILLIIQISNEKYIFPSVQGLQVYLEQIDQIEDNISKLEQAAYKLDAYTVRLENKFKALSSEKR